MEPPDGLSEWLVAVIVPLPYGKTELCPVRALTAWLEVAGITSGPVFRRIWLPKKTLSLSGRQDSERPERQTGGQPPFGATPAGVAPPLPEIGSQPITPWAVAEIVKSRAQQAGFGGRDFGGHSLKRGALTTGMDRGEHPAKGLSLDNRIGRKESMAEEKRNERLRKWR